VISKVVAGRIGEGSEGNVWVFLGLRLSTIVSGKWLTRCWKGCGKESELCGWRPAHEERVWKWGCEEEKTVVRLKISPREGRDDFGKVFHLMNAFQIKDESGICSTDGRPATNENNTEGKVQKEVERRRRSM
jgi:hypothetical protein